MVPMAGLEPARLAATDFPRPTTFVAPFGFGCWTIP